jgi:quercetin dioxygenase-like cupin family protein
MKSTNFLLFATMAFGLTALAAPGGAPSTDPAVVNAKTVHVTFENDRVRVLESVLQSGDQEQMHSHPAYMIYVLEGGKMRNHAADGTTSEAEFVAGQTIFREPLTHWAENIGTTTVRVLLVELKSPR